MSRPLSRSRGRVAASAVLVALATTTAAPFAAAGGDPARNDGGRQDAESPLVADVRRLADDELAGRQNGTAGSALAQEHLVDRLDDIAVGLDPTRSGAEAFRQPFAGGTNILALIPGDELPDEYVVVGAHYDHVGSSCATSDPRDRICNGATDNAAGVAAVLSIGEMIARSGPPRRSVVLAFWDREEDGLLGSGHYVRNPLVPLADTVAYVNADILGSNLLPGLKRTTFAIGAESGGDRLVSAVDRAARPGPLHTGRLSAIFGQGRSDYLHFLAAQVPTVFFSDSTGRCYHTAQDEIGVVDLWKLQHQALSGYRLTRDLAEGERPDFVAAPLATYDDAVVLGEVGTRMTADLHLLSPPIREQLEAHRGQIDAIVAAGPGEFGADDVPTLLIAAANTVSALTRGDCDGFLRP